MLVTCEKCKETVGVSMYYHDVGIITAEYPLEQAKVYEAKVWGKFVCPLCGGMNDHKFTTSISKSDIINLCVKGENRT